jgi:hypothetical protein
MLRAQLCTHINTAMAVLQVQLYTYINTATLYTVRAVLQVQLYTYINADHFVYIKVCTAGTIGKVVEVVFSLNAK